MTSRRAAGRPSCVPAGTGGADPAEVRRMSMNAARRDRSDSRGEWSEPLVAQAGRQRPRASDASSPPDRLQMTYMPTPLFAAHGRRWLTDRLIDRIGLHFRRQPR